MNELLWLGMLAVNFAGILIVYRLFGRLGLYIWVPIAAIVANIQVVKYVELFGLTATLGNIVYASSFLVTDILSENYGRREASRAVAVGFVALIAMVVLMNFSLLFVPDPADTAQPHLEAIFTLLPRITLASLLAYVVSQYHDIWAYHLWKKRIPGRNGIWIRNNLSTLVSQLIDSVVFTLAAFLGQVPWPILVEIVVTTYVLKAIVAVADTPLVYLANHWHRSGTTTADGEP
ncbi:MAG: queuosine precursor transporter [Spirochaetota bacterium]